MFESCALQPNRRQSVSRRASSESGETAFCAGMGEGKCRAHAAKSAFERVWKPGLNHLQRHRNAWLVSVCHLRDRLVFAQRDVENPTAPTVRGPPNSIPIPNYPPALTARSDRSSGISLPDRADSPRINSELGRPGSCFSLFSPSLLCKNRLPPSIHRATRLQRPIPQARTNWLARSMTNSGNLRASWWCGSAQDKPCSQRSWCTRPTSSWRNKRAQKRTPIVGRIVALDELLASYEDRAVDFEGLDEALKGLSKVPRIRV